MLARVVLIVALLAITQAAYQQREPMRLRRKPRSPLGNAVSRSVRIGS
jgi:hypothetical protein